jgi:hypothetical protein
MESAAMRRMSRMARWPDRKQINELNYWFDTMQAVKNSVPSTTVGID